MGPVWTGMGASIGMLGGGIDGIPGGAPPATPLMSVPPGMGAPGSGGGASYTGIGATVVLRAGVGGPVGGAATGAGGGAGEFARLVVGVGRALLAGVGCPPVAANAFFFALCRRALVLADPALAGPQCRVE